MVQLSRHFTRRPVLGMAAAILLSTTSAAWAQTAWPNKPVKIVVPFAPGGTTDILARAIAPDLSKAFGQSFVIENKGGAGGNLGAEQVAKSAGDGYTLLMGTVGTHGINRALYAKLPYDTLADFQPISQIITYQYALIVPEKSTIKTVQDLAAQAKAKPGELTYGSSGVGGGGHLAGELLALVQGVKLNQRMDSPAPKRASTPRRVGISGWNSILWRPSLSASSLWNSGRSCSTV